MNMWPIKKVQQVTQGNKNKNFLRMKSKYRRRAGLLEQQKMKEHFDFASMKGKKNPYTKYLKLPVTMLLDRDSVDYFKSLAKEIGIPYQTLINLYLRDCAVNHRKLAM